MRIDNNDPTDTPGFFHYCGMPNVIGAQRLSDNQLQDLVDGSTLTFIGRVKELNNSYVSGIDKDSAIIAEVKSVESADPQALKTFGDLNGTS